MMETKSRIPQSSIPVKVSRPPQSAMPSTLSTPYLGLVSPSRHLSVSDSPTYPIPSCSSSASSTGGGIAPLRSFRNLLPFGSSSKNSSPNVNPGGSKSSFASFTSIRRSINGDRHGERSVSAPQLRTARSQEERPVIPIELTPSLELSHKVNEPLISQEDLPQGLNIYSFSKHISSPKSAPAQVTTLEDKATDSAAPHALGMSDLSTIMELETSGISRHLPELNDSQDQRSNESVQGLSASSFLPPLDQSSQRTQSPQDTSALELSTSDVPNQVLEALNETQRREGWLHGVVIDDAGSHNDTVPGAGDPNVSFSLGDIDPDLAVILSPNRFDSAKSGVQTAVDSLSPPPTTSHPSQSRRPSAVSSLVPTIAASSPKSSPRHRSNSLSRPAASKLPALTIPTRLARSASERPIHVPPPFPSPITKSTPSRSSDIGERPSLAARRLGTSPLSPGRDLPRRPHSGSGVESRLSAATRLTPPSKLSPTRSLLREASSPTSAKALDADSTSPSRSLSSSGGAVGQKYGRPSLDSSADRLRSLPLRARKRSASISGSPASGLYRSSSSQPSTLERMGPRTARAFAAAGLIDVDKDNSGLSDSRSASRFGTTRSERDLRPHYAPSRLAFSESGSTWGRRSGSISRAGAMSEVTSAHLSETLSTPRTTLSAASTAPTSISARSSPRYSLTDMHKMHEQHNLQTETLMNALADSQTTTRLLREENMQLRDRIHDLENRLADAMNELQRMQFVSLQQQASQGQAHNSIPRTNFHRLAGSRMAEFSFRPPVSRADQSPSLHSKDGCTNITTLEPSPEIVGPPSSVYTSRDSHGDYMASPVHSHGRRFSNSSSIFPGPPSTMSMLLNEEGLTSDVPSKSSPSPTLVMSKLPTRQVHGSSHPIHHRAASSGNISPTTANFSMLTGSPGSLNLRPEHEKLLGDMPPLDLGDDYEPSAYEVPTQ